MSQYQKIDPRIWNDEKFAFLSDNAKLVFFMVLTHPSMKTPGATSAQLAEHLAGRTKPLWKP